MRPRLPKLNIPKDALLHGGLVLALAANLIQAMAYYNAVRHPAVVIYDPDRGVADMLDGLRQERLHDVLLPAGFLEAARIATAAAPYPVQPGEHRLKGEIVGQFYINPLVSRIQDLRKAYGMRTSAGVPRLSVDAAAVQIRRNGDQFLIQADVTQIIPGGEQSLRLLRIQGLAALTDLSFQNPYGLKFTEFKVSEIKPVTGDTP